MKVTNTRSPSPHQPLPRWIVQGGLGCTALLATGCSIGSWTMGIGDPTPMGWITVILYFVTSYLCFKCVLIEKRGPARPLGQTLQALYRVTTKHWPNVPAPARRSLLWLIIAVVYFCLGINKQLDLQSALTEIGRLIARTGGWYEQRGQLQRGFILAVIIAGLGATAWLFGFARNVARPFILPLLGVIATVSFVLIRASSFHRMDILISSELLGMRMNWLFEIGGISLVALGAILRLGNVGPSEP